MLQSRLKRPCKPLAQSLEAWVSKGLIMAYRLNDKGRLVKVKLPTRLPKEIIDKVENNPEAEKKINKLMESYEKASKNVRICF